MNIPVELRKVYKRNNFNAMQSIHRHKLTDVYIRKLLRYNIDDITPEMINIKRDIILFKRKRNLL